MILKPGDVLFVPKHWWHYVESQETSISVNTWIELVTISKKKCADWVVHAIYVCNAFQLCQGKFQINICGQFWIELWQNSKYILADVWHAGCCFGGLCLGSWLQFSSLAAWTSSDFVLSVLDEQKLATNLGLQPRKGSSLQGWVFWTFDWFLSQPNICVFVCLFVCL